MMVGCNGGTQGAEDVSSVPDSTGLEDGTIEGDSSLTDFCNLNIGYDLYKRRIEPLVSGAIPSSCNQCHLSGVELSMFQGNNACETMACMTAMDLIDLDSPESSVILEQIQNADPASLLITAEVLQAEYDAFLQWIEFGSQCFDEVCKETELICGDEPPATPPGDGVLTPLGDCSETAIAQSFTDKVMTHQGRCKNCHGVVDSDLGEAGAPYWLDMGFKNGGTLFESGRNSMYNLIGLGAVNIEDPAKSKMACRHLALQAGGCGPGDHIKFENKADPAYQGIITWLNEYSTCYLGQ
jgi:hypothetical protein